MAHNQPKESKETSSQSAGARDPSVEVEIQVADQVGRMMDFWGFKRVHGRIWAILYLSTEPLSNAQIQQRLGISVGAASMALAELRQFGVVREAPVQRRAVHYEPETNIWRIVSRVLAQRERQVLIECAETFTHVLSVLRKENKPENSYVVNRIERLMRMTTLAQGMLNVLLSRGEVNSEDIFSLSL